MRILPPDVRPGLLRPHQTASPWILPERQALLCVSLYRWGHSLRGTISLLQHHVAGMWGASLVRGPITFLQHHFMSPESGPESDQCIPAWEVNTCAFALRAWDQQSELFLLTVSFQMEEFSQREHLQPVKDPLPVCPFRLSSLDDFQGLGAQICLTG